MKNLLATILFACISLSCFAQEFKVHENGLIYSPETMTQLHHIVDSLNLKFIACDLDKVYQSKKQAKGIYFTLEDANAKKALIDLQNNISFEDFLAKYPKTEVEENQLIIRSEYTNYSDEEVIEFSTIPIGDNYEKSIMFGKHNKTYIENIKSNFIFIYHKKTSYSDEYLKGFYSKTGFSSIVLPEKYARMLQYSECMINPSKTILLEGSKNNFYDTSDTVNTFLDYVNTKARKPKYTNDNSWKKILDWETTKMDTVDTFAHETKFKRLLKDAVDDVLKNGNSNDELEAYITRYYSKKIALNLKRSRRVIGRCSMDDSPRIHAQNIAILSAEALEWDIFLRAHLNIMNDRFERASDGSYAFARRKTYIKELERLDLNITDLILGISLRFENTEDNHYYGSIRRIGRALSESAYKDIVRNELLCMIQDDSLDAYNRVLMYYLFRNYNYYLKDKDEQSKNKEKLLDAVANMPAYLSNQIIADLHKKE